MPYYLKRILFAVYLFTTCLTLRAQTFTDVAFQKGINIDFSSSNIYGYTFGSGVSFYDFTQNGWDDLTFVVENDSILFYINNEGIFEKSKSFIYGYGQAKQLLWVDYDNDGHLDLFVTSYDSTYRLYRNDGNFNFTDVTVSSGLINTPISRSYGASWGDFNRNGYLDLYVCKYHVEFAPTIPENLNQLYMNNGDGTFTNVTLQAGVGDGTLASFQSVWFDYDMDGWPDLFVINDFNPSNSLYRNNGDGTFMNVNDSAGVSMPTQHSMSASLADFNNNGLLDIYMTNSGFFFNHFGMLLVNNGDGSFTESASVYGVDNDKWAWGSLWVDYNNNSFQDLYVATGVITDLYNQIDVRNYFYENIGGQHFVNSTHIFDTHDSIRSFSVARGDINNNGYYDIVVHNNSPANAYLWENSGGNNNWVKITLQGTASNRMAIGSWIRVFAGGNQYTQYTFCGENYLGQNSQHHIFGLAEFTMIDSVQIEYSRGHIDTYYDLQVNQHYYFTEGETWAPEIEIIGNLIFCIGDSVVLSAQNDTQATSFFWNNGYSGSELVIKESGIYWLVLENDFHITKYSDTFNVVVVQNTLIQQNVSHISCYGEADGLVSLTVNTEADSFNIAWDNGDTGTHLNNLAQGKYIYTYTDDNGCLLKDSIFIFEPFGFNVQKQIIHSYTGLNNGTLQIVVNGGTPPYNYYLNDEQIGTLTENLPPGKYELHIIDANGCEYTTEIEILELMTNYIYQDILSQSLTIFPNPVFDENLTIQANYLFDEKVDVIVYNSLGSIVMIKENLRFIDGNLKIRVPFPAAGLYKVNLTSNSLNQKLLILFVD